MLSMVNNMPEVGMTSHAIANVLAARLRSNANGQRSMFRIDGNNAEMRFKTPAERNGNKACKTAKQSIMS